MPKLTREDVTICDRYAEGSTPLYVRWLIRTADRFYLVESRDRINGGTNRPAPETVVFPTAADGSQMVDDSDAADALFDACIVPALDHELAITALVAHLNGEPAPVFECPKPAPKPEPAPPFDLVQRLREMAANDPKLSDDSFVLLSRAFDGRPILDDPTNPNI